MTNEFVLQNFHSLRTVLPLPAMTRAPYRDDVARHYASTTIELN
jgi:hypothetical protein